MPLATINDHVFFFVHVPKCGGTSVERFLADHGRLSLHGEVWTIGYAACSPQHIHRAVYERFIKPTGYDHGFIVFRDPLERLKSEFRMKARPPGKSLNPVNLLMRLRAAFTGGRLYELRFRGIPLHLDFALWSRCALLAARLRPYIADNHFRPQNEFWREDHKVFFLEDGLEPVFRWLAETAGLSPPAETIRENRGETVDIVCSPATERLIRRFYAKDYELFARLRAARD